MIEKSGKLFVNGCEYPRRYDKNEDFGYDGEKVVFYEIVSENVLIGRKETGLLHKLIIGYSMITWLFKHRFFDGSTWKLTVSKHRELRHGTDFMTLAFDPERAERVNGEKA